MKTLKWVLIGLVILRVAALATPRSGLLFMTILNRATAAAAIHTVGHAASWNVVLQVNGPSDFMVQYTAAMRQADTVDGTAIQGRYS